MKNPPIDILLASFNGSQFIESQLDSIFGQTYQNIHVIIRDDFSTDNTRKILEDYAGRFPEKMTVVLSETRLGVKGNFSCLMSHSRSPYVMFSDQDDVWHPDKAAATLEKMTRIEKQSSPETPLLVHTDLRVVDKDLRILADSFWKYTGIDPKKMTSLNRLLMQNRVTGCTVMINRPLLSLAAPIPKECAMHDWWLALVAATFGRIEALPQATMDYRQHGSNALGASKFLSVDYFKRGLKKLRSPEKAKHMQAKEMLTRYQDLLNLDQKRMLLAFQRLSKASFLEKTVLILKQGFFKSGFLRNAVNIFFKKQ